MQVSSEGERTGVPWTSLAEKAKEKEMEEKGDTEAKGDSEGKAQWRSGSKRRLTWRPVVHTPRPQQTRKKRRQQKRK